MNGTFIQCKNFGSRLFRFVTIHTFEGQTDRIAIAIPCVALHAVAR